MMLLKILLNIWIKTIVSFRDIKIIIILICHRGFLHQNGSIFSEKGVDNEIVYKMANVMNECGGLEAILKR